MVDFICHKAIPFEENRVCRTFLAVSEEDLSAGVLTVLGYFTLQYTQSHANEESLGQLDTGLREIIGTNHDSTSGVLLVQLARDSRFNKKDLSGATLLLNAERQARLMCDYVGGELIYLERGDQLREYYASRGYVEIEEIPGEDGGDGFFKMQKLLYPEQSPVLEALVSGASTKHGNGRKSGTALHNIYVLAYNSPARREASECERYTAPLPPLSRYSLGLTPLSADRSCIRPRRTRAARPPGVPCHMPKNGPQGAKGA